MAMEQLPLEPVARHSDPSTAHAAATRSKSGSAAMNAAILRATSDKYARTAFQIAERVAFDEPTRWDEGSVRTAVSRLHKAGKLRVLDKLGRSPRRQACYRYYR